MATDAARIHEYGMAKTQRRDAWWAGPLVTGLVLGSFVVTLRKRGKIRKPLAKIWAPCILRDPN